MPENNQNSPYLRGYFDNTESIILIIESNKKIAFLNRYACELIGYKLEDIIGKNSFQILIPKRKREELITYFENIFQSKYEILKIYSFPIVIKDGSERMILWKNSLIRSEDNKINAVMCIGDDITDRKQLERELKFEKDLKSKIVEICPIGITVVNKIGEIIFTNSQAEKVLHLSEGEIFQRYYNDEKWKITDYEGNPFSNENLPFSIVKRIKKSVFDIKHIIQGPNDVKIFLNINAMPLLDASNNFNGMVASIEDVTERIKSQREIYRFNRAYKMLSECNSQLIQIFDESELFQKICDIIIDVGVYRLAWVGIKIEDDTKSVEPVAQAGFEDGYLKKLDISWAKTERGKGPTGTAIRIAKPVICRDINNDPSFKPWREDAIRQGYKSSMAIPFAVENDGIGTLNIYSDREDAFNVEEQKLLEKLVENLAFGVEKIRSEIKKQEAEDKYKKAYNRVEFYKDLFAHDINNILQGILMGLQLIQSDIGESQDFADIIENSKMIEKDIHRGSRLVSNIRKFSLIEKNQLPLIKINVFNILKELIEIYYKRFPKRTLDIKMESDFTQINVLANALIEDVFDNLLLNALTHNDSEKIEILIRIVRVESDNIKYIKFEFMDNGRGIEKHQKDKIFLRSDEEKRDVHGRGLGLSLVKKIIDSYNGLIWVEDRVKSDFSKGSNFILMIPEVIIN